MAKRITFIRHGNTAKAASDIERPLTEKGKEQAVARRVALGRDFDLVLASPAPRAMDTAVIIANCSADQVIVLSNLYLPSDPADKAAVDELANTLAYSPLRAYRKADTSGVLKRYGATAVYDINLMINTDLSEEILVVAHAVLINAVVAAMVGIDTDEVLDANLGECEGIEVTFGPIVSLIK